MLLNVTPCDQERRYLGCVSRSLAVQFRPVCSIARRIAVAQIRLDFQVVPRITQQPPALAW